MSTQALPSRVPSLQRRRILTSPALALGAVYGALLLWAATSVPDVFFTSPNLGSITDTLVVPLLVGLPVAIGLLGNVQDLSVGAVVGMSSAVFSSVYNSSGSFGTAVLVAVAAGVVVGIVNVVVCIGFGTDPLIGTLGAYVAVTGIQQLIADNNQTAFSQAWFDATGHRWLGVNSGVVLILVLFLLASMWLRTTRSGQHLLAVGGNALSAQRAGIRVDRTRALLLVAIATTAAIGGVVYVGQLGAAPSTLGSGLELKVYGGILLAGFSLTRGGVGSLTAAALGIALLSVSSNVLDLNGVSSSYQDAVTGVLVIAAVFIDTRRPGGERFR